MNEYKKVRLGDVCEKGSSNIAQNEILENEGNYPIYGAAGFIKNVDFYKQEEPYIGIVKDGAGVGRVSVHPAKSSLIGTMQYIFPKENIEIGYLAAYLKSQNLGSLYKGAAIPHIYFKDYENFQIPLPPKETQKQIASSLDKITKIITENKTLLEKYDLLIKSRFIEMFGDLKQNSKNWQIKNFKECAKIDTNMVKDFEKYADYPHIGIDSIEKETGKLSGYRTVKEDNVISGKYLFTPEHIIYSKIRPNLNKVAMPDFYGVCSADAYPILVDKEICSKEFFTYVLRSDFYLSYILAFSSRTNMPKVNKEQVESFNMPVPPIELQNDFAAFVQQIDKSKFEIWRYLKFSDIMNKIGFRFYD